MDDGSVLTADELISRSGDLGAAALQQANAILIPGTLLDAAAIYAICSYLEHMFERRTYQCFYRYAVMILGRQLTDPVPNDEFFRTCQAEYDAGEALLQQPNSITLWVYYLLPMTVMGLAYYQKFPIFLPYERCPDLFFGTVDLTQGRRHAYEAIRLDHSVRIMQIRFAILRSVLLTQEDVACPTN